MEGGPTEPTAAVELSAPARVIARDDLRRSRLTVFFRLLLAIPHFVLLAAWSVLMALVAILNWLAVLVTGKAIAVGLISRYLRYYTHVGAYVNLGANPFPGFGGEAGSYPVDLELPEPRRQSRLKAAFRIPLAVPALLLAFVLVSPGGYLQTDGATETSITLGVIPIAAFLGWFVSLALGRMAQGLRDLIAYGIGYFAQLLAYLLLRDDRYPNSDPLLPGYAQPAPDHPIRISVGDELRRSRMTVLFRLPLWLPHMVWLVLWGVVVLLAVVASWLATLVAGQPPGFLHKFIGAYVRYATHATAFLYLVGNPFPGFAGKAGAYPIDLRIAPRERQSRWKTGLRFVLSIPALLVAGALANALVLVAVFGWFVGLILGRMPEGLRNLGAFALRYNAQAWAYLALLTDRYPFAGPSLELLADPAAENPVD